jgi:hypothetical protein
MKKSFYIVCVLIFFGIVWGVTMWRTHQPKFSDDHGADVELIWLISIADANEYYYDKNGEYPSGNLEQASIALRGVEGAQELYLLDKFFGENGMLVDGWGMPIRLSHFEGNLVLESSGKNKIWGDSDDYRYIEPLDKKFEHGPPSGFPYK